MRFEQARGNPADHDAPLRLAYLTYRGKPHIGGQGVYTRHLTKALVDLGHHVEVFSGQPYPVLDERVPMVKLASLDIFNDLYPGRFPAYWELKSLGRPRRGGPVLQGHLQRAAGLQRAGLRELQRRRASSTSSTTTRASATACCASSSCCPPSSPCTTRSPRTASWRWPTPRARKKRRQVGRWYSFIKMQARVARQMPRIVVVSENSINDIHDDFGVAYDRMRLVPVGVDPDLFRPLARGGARARPAHHHRQLRRRPEGAGLPAGGPGQAAHRAGREPHGHRQAEAGRAGRGHHRAARSDRRHPVRVGRLRRAHRRAVRRGRAGRGAQPVRGLLPARRRGHGHRHLPRGHRRRRPARGDRDRRRHRPVVPGRRRRRAGRHPPPRPRRRRAAGPCRRRRP